MRLICDLFSAYYIILFLRIIFSFVVTFWSPPSYMSPAISLLYTLTEPVLAPFRRLIPPMGGLDFSPIFVFIILQLVARAIGCG